MQTGLTAGYYAEIDILCVLILGLLAVKTIGSSFISEQKRSYTVVLLCHIVFAISDLVWIFNNGFLPLLGVFPKYGVALSYLANSLNVIASGVTGFAWLAFSEIIQKHNILKDRKKLALYLLPLVILVLLTATTWFTHIMFSVSEQGEFSRGVGYVIQVIVSMGYIVLATVRSLRRTRQKITMKERQEARAVAAFIKLPLCGILLQLLFPEMQMLFLGTVAALVEVFIALQHTQVLIDPLTGLNNRMILDQKAEEAIRAWNGEQEELYLLLIDANDFKQINDKYGHVTGDLVLKMIAGVLQKLCGDKDYLCRYGGDEFVVLLHMPSGEGCTQIAHRIDEDLAALDAPCRISVSVGACRYTPDIEGLEEFIKRADEDMYRIKAAKKSAAKKSADMREKDNGERDASKKIDRR